MLIIHYPHIQIAAIGKVWIYRLLFVCVFVSLIAMVYVLKMLNLPVTSVTVYWQLVSMSCLYIDIFLLKQLKL